MIIIITTIMIIALNDSLILIVNVICRYLCGIKYFEEGKRLFPKHCDKCMVVHNNWIVSKELKFTDSKSI